MKPKLNSGIDALLELIEHTDYVATRIHGKLSQADIFKVITDEFRPSGQQRLMIFMLSEDKKNFVVGAHTFPSNQIKLIEILIRNKVMGLRIPFEKLPILHSVIEKEETYSFPSIDFIREYFPSGLVETVTKIVNHTNPPTLVSPILIDGKVSGVLAIESPEVPGYMDHLKSSVKNLARHISSAIDLGIQYQSQLITERRFRDIFDNTKDAIAGINEEGKVIAWNKAAEEMFGYTESEMLNEYYRILVPEECRDDRLHMLERVKSHGFVVNYETVRQRKDSKRITVEMSVSTGSSTDGELSYTAILRDITQRKIAEQELLVQNRAMDVAHQGIVITDPTKKDNPIVDCNLTFERLTGYTTEEILGKNCRFLQGPESDPVIVKEIRDAVKNKRDYSCEIVNYKKDGTKFWNELVITGVRNSEGELLNYIGMQTDITVRKQRQLELKKLSAAVEQSPASVVITDLDGKINYVNPRFEEVTGYSAQKAMGVNPRLLKSGHTSKEEYKELWETITAGKIWTGEFHNRKRDGTLYWERASIGPIFNDVGEITDYLAVKEDVTEMKETQATLRDTLANMEGLIEERTSELSSAKAELELAHAEFISSLHYAKRIQQASLPSGIDFRKAFEKHFIMYLPKDVVSGDFYWLNENNHELVLAMGDCTGHGVPGALMAMAGIEQLSNIVTKGNITKPSNVLQELDQALKRMLHQNESGVMMNDGMDISVVRIDKLNGVFDYAGAQSHGLLIKKDTVVKLIPDRASLGGHINTGFKEFTTQRYQYEPGDRLFLFCDGVYDQFGGEHGKKMLRKRFTQFLIDSTSYDMTEQGKAVSKFFNDWLGDNFQIDDVTVVGVEL